MVNEACSYGAYCICVAFPTKIDLKKCKCTKWANNCNNELHHMCQTSYMSKVNYDDALQYICIECMNKTVNDIALKEANNSQDNDEYPDKKESDNIDEISDEKRSDDISSQDNDKASDEKQSAAVTTSRNQQNKILKKKSIKCKKGARVKIRRDNLFHILTDPRQKVGLEKFGNSRNFHGDIISGNGKTGYYINFDDLPSGLQKVYVKRRNIITVADKEEEEKEHDHANDEYHESTKKKEALVGCMLRSQKDFEKLDDDVVLSSNSFGMSYEDENKIEKTLKWEIIDELKVVNLGGVNFDIDVSWKKDIKLNDNEDNLHNIFFDDFFPCVKGHAKLIDEYHQNPNSSYHITVTHDNIKFDDGDPDDPDWMVKQCYLIMIAAVAEVDCGIDNLWRRGKSNGRRYYPNFGKYIGKNYFKAFICAAPYCFCEKRFWFVDKRDKPWDIFLPCTKDYNAKRQ